MGKVGLIQGFELIAAGECIERPASVVKELVENSLDAESSHITVNIEGAGKTLIQIMDDGTGIDPEDVPIIFQRHYSSKIHSAAELENIETFGFRGEALASIAAVAQIELITRTKDNQLGKRLVLNAGKREALEDCGAPIGSSLKVRNLFFNLPVRRKFLHSDRVELGHISDVVSRYALAYPQVHFKLIHNELTLLNSPAWTSQDPKISQWLEEKNAQISRRNWQLPIEAYMHSIKNIMGAKIGDRMIPINIQSDFIHIYGLIGKPELARSEKTAASLFVNHRLVTNLSISEIMEKAYSDYLMRGKYPYYVLFINVPPNRVDFNVHPSKRIVKFIDEGPFMNKLQNILEILVKNNFKEYNLPVSLQINSSNEKRAIPIDVWTPPSKVEPESIKISSSPSPKIETNFNKKTQNKGRSSLEKAVFDKKPVIQKHFAVSDSSSPSLDRILNESENIQTEKLPNFRFLNSVGQIGNTYLVFQSETGLILIDQHAAHERINYERVQKAFRDARMPIQSLITPIKLDVAPNETEFVKAALNDLKSYGFTLDYFGGNTFLIRAIPAFIQNTDHPSLIVDLCLEILRMGRERSLSSIRTEIIQYLACHKSLRAGEEIWNREKIRKLIQELDQCENPHHCAHGRPTYIIISFDELEKLFGRKI